MTNDADLFRALVRCPRICMTGSAGVDPTTGRRLYPDRPGQVHFGAHLSTDTQNERTWNPDWGRLCIRALADDVLAAEGSPVPSEDPGASEEADAARFRALMRTPRIRVMWHAGRDVGTDIDPDRPQADPDKPGSFFFSAEFWSSGTPDPSGQDEPAVGRLCLHALAEDVLAHERASGAPA